MKPSLVSTLLLVSTLANSQAQRRHINKRADDQGPLEPVVTQLSADLAALTATVQALQAKLGRFLNSDFCTLHTATFRPNWADF